MAPGGYRIGPRFQLWLGGIAGGGVVVAHALAYLIAAPDSHERAHLLQSTGHRYWVLISSLALAGLAAGLLKLTLGLGRTIGAIDGPRLFATTATRLAVLQVSGFTLLELLERIFGHNSFTELWGEPVFHIGLLIQILLALAGATFLVLFSRTVLAFKRRGVAPKAPRAVPLVYVFDRVFSSRPAVATGSGTLRGPPQTS